MSKNIHGNIKITRRKNVDKKVYGEYKTELRQDFHKMCGYCGKLEEVTQKNFEIDHFVPRRLAPELKDEYTNLVWSCFQCNRKKGKKWPTENKNLSNDGNIGFIDPASEEYNTALCINENGEILPLNSVGKYMAYDVFKFQIRPMSAIYTANRIFMLKKEIMKKREQKEALPKELYEKYVDLDIELEKIRDCLFGKNE